ncbi:MAG: 16S rRNA (cytosine(1402)-N(4))-methyltransferase RsmH [Cocleimonas sp.]
MSNQFKHETVLLSEAVAALAIKSNGVYIDATFGRGGHSAEILKQLGPDGLLLLIDKDPLAIAHAKESYKDDKRIFVWQGSFKDFPDALQEAGVEKADGLLLDLGVSSPQLDDASRGFSFMRDGELDMRMNPDEGLSAAEWLSKASDEEIANVLYQYGDERFSRRIGRTIVEKRAETPISTTLQLAEIIASCIPMKIQRKELGKHPATRSFQAIRIFINRELDDLIDCLDNSKEFLANKGRLVVISFHSLEDRIVKRFIKAQSSPPQIPRGIPIMESEFDKPIFKSVGKAIKPTRDEVQVNTRSRSAIMRIGERQ